MTGTTRVGSYRTLLTRPRVLPLVALASAGRLGYAMLPLLYLFTLRDATGSFTTAATAMSMLGLAGLAMPITARLIDHHGQARVLTFLALTHLAAVETVVTLAATGTRLPAPAWIALTAASGLVAPPLGPSMRAQWRVIEPDDTDTAYALDGTVEEVLWLAGPALAGVLLTITKPAVGLALVPFLLTTGALGLATSRWRPTPATDSATPEASGDDAGQPAPRSRRSAIRSRSLWPILATMALTGVAGALTTTGIAATADAFGSRALAAVGEVSLGVGAVVGGLLWGRHRPAWPPRISTAVLLAVWAAVVAVLCLVGINSLTLTVLALAGAASAPIWVLSYGAADVSVPEYARTEASTWVTTSANLGTAGGTALTGVLVATLGATSPLVTASLIAATIAPLTLLTWRRQPR